MMFVFDISADEELELIRRAYKACLIIGLAKRLVTAAAM